MNLLRILALVLPLGFDTFAMGTALGLGGVTGRDRTRASLVFTAFEATMPVIGLLVGAGVGHVIGHGSRYLAAAAFLGIGGWILWSSRSDGDEDEGVELLGRTRGMAILGLGLSVSMDELAIGFGAGLLRVPVGLLILLIPAQAFCAAQIGMRLGARIGEAASEWAERLAAVLLIGAAVLVVTVD